MKKKTDKLTFEKATNAQKRVMIATDVISQIKAKRYVPTTGIWVLPKMSAYDTCSAEFGAKSVKTLFADKTIKTCEVCALGGLFMSCTNLNNNTTFSELDNEGSDIGAEIDAGKKFSNGLNKFFSEIQLKLIEIYFEGRVGWFHKDSSVRINHNRVEAFHYEFDNNQDTLLMKIMENIIANDGTFVPGKLKVDEKHLKFLNKSDDEDVTVSDY